MQRFKILISFFVLILLISCSPTQINQVSPTPTFAIPRSDNSYQSSEIVAIKPVLQITIAPFDFANTAETQEEVYKATLEAIQKVNIHIDAAEIKGEISPFIYGTAISEESVIKEVLPSVYSWIGDGTVRYNVKTGQGWNIGREGLYKNEDPFPQSRNHADDFLTLAESVGASSSFTLPTIGWGAKDTSSCSFPDGKSEDCTRALESTCISNSLTADPTQTSEILTPADILNFLQMVKDSGRKIDFIPLLYEPELWGIIHYDLHPECTTYAEILELYTSYAAAIRDEVPSTMLMGPGTCCYEFYFNSASGEEDKAKHDDMDFIPWFLQSMKAFDEEAGKRHLDVLDIHYYPEGIVNDFDDALIAERRLRAPRSLFDPLYTDESYINEPVRLIPRMNDWIDTYYPGTKLAIGAWDFGAPNTMNGALAIAEVLGIYGQQGLYYASYFPAIEQNTPAYYAFRMFTNFDGQNGKFGNLSLTTESDHPEEVSAYSSLDSESGNLHIILINRVQEAVDLRTEIEWEGFESSGKGFIYTFADNLFEEEPRIVGGPAQMGTNKQIVTLPSYSITHMILEPNK
ncbi:MAG: hypothetical protein ACI9EW_001188 [Cellvibrionaceae bacterium]|jgi:hypothetical protein